MATWAYDVKISQPPGETGGYSMPSSINTGNTQQITWLVWVVWSFSNPVLDALGLCCRPDMVDMTRVSGQTNRSNLEHAFCAAEQLGVPRLLDPEGGCGFRFRPVSLKLIRFWWPSASLCRCRRSVSRWKVSHHVCFNAVWCLSKSTWWCWGNQS